MITLNEIRNYHDKTRILIKDESFIYLFPHKTHFVRDFKSVCGMAPQVYRKGLPDFYSDVVKF